MSGIVQQVLTVVRPCSSLEMEGRKKKTVKQTKKYIKNDKAIVGNKMNALPYFRIAYHANSARTKDFTFWKF